MEEAIPKPNEIKETEETKKPSHKKKWVWVFLLIGLGHAALFYGGWLYFQRPAIGDVWTSTGVSREDTDSKNDRKEYRGEYLVFSYPTSYDEKTRTLPVKGPVKESIFLSASDLEGGKIAVVLEKRAEKRIEVSPGYQMRENKPKEYEKRSFSLGGYTGTLFEKKTTVFERTFYFQDGEFVVSISVTSPLSADALEQELSDILTSIRFLE